MFMSPVFPAQHQMTYVWNQQNGANMFVQRTTMIPVAVPVFIPVPMVPAFPMRPVPFYFPPSSPAPSTSFQMEATADAKNESVDSGVDMDETDPSLSQDMTLPVSPRKQEDCHVDVEEMEEGNEECRLSPEDVEELECLDVLATLGVTKTLHRFGVL